MRTETVPLFPLKTVLFPGGILPLRIFEPRYLSMIAGCLKQDTGFAVVLSGDDGPEFHPIGTIARIIDWDRGDDGLLHITARGGKRCRIERSWKREDGLQVGSVELLADLPEEDVPREHETLVELVRRVIEQLEAPYDKLEIDYSDAGWVGARLAEFLPVSLQQKQVCLEMEDPVERLNQLRPVVESLRANEPN